MYTYKFKNEFHCTTLKRMGIKDKLCRIRMFAITDALDQAMDLWEISNCPSLEFEVVEQSEDGSETVIYRMKKENDNYTFAHVGWEHCERGYNYGF